PAPGWCHERGGLGDRPRQATKHRSPVNCASRPAEPLSGRSNDQENPSQPLNSIPIPTSISCSSNRLLHAACSISIPSSRYRPAIASRSCATPLTDLAITARAAPPNAASSPRPSPRLRSSSPLAPFFLSALRPP
ncbi:hypothetical protein T310_8870, partial [Rasamsonia emersonii CBS 393.64]